MWDMQMRIILKYNVWNIALNKKSSNVANDSDNLVLQKKPTCVELFMPQVSGHEFFMT